MATVDSDLFADAPVLRARIPVQPGAVDALLEATCGEDPAPGAFQDLETGGCWVEIFGIDETAVRRSCDAVFAAAAEIGAEPGAREPEIVRLPREDWAESWKRFFKTIRVSRRVTVRPPWEAYEPESPDEAVVTIEPGMSFGTGLHATTQNCLSFLEELADEDRAAVAPPRSVADLGCGSGILSIASRKLGFSPVCGADYDLAAVRVSAENAILNGVPDIAFSRCDVTCDPVPRADVVVANILAPVLRRAAPRIAEAVAPGPCGALVLSGILETQWDGVVAAYSALGFREVRTETRGEWKSGLLKRK